MQTEYMYTVLQTSFCFKS